MDVPLTPFVEWTSEEIQERIAALPRLAKQDLRDLVECLSEGIEDIPKSMQKYYEAVQAQLAMREAVPVWEYDSQGPATPEQRAQARENIRRLSDAVLDQLIAALTLEPGEPELPADMAEDLERMRAERDARRAAQRLPPGT